MGKTKGSDEVLVCVCVCLFVVKKQENVVQEGLKAANAEWAVLVVDDVTLKVLSSACRVSDVMDQGISVVEHLKKKRQPYPRMAAIYFISPSQGSFSALASDFSSSAPLYAQAHVFVSSLAGAHEMAFLKSCSSLLHHLYTLREAQVEFLAEDSRAFTTANEDALVQLFSPSVTESSRSSTVESIATRIASALASLHEMPSIRYCSVLGQQQQPSSSTQQHGHRLDTPASQVAHSLNDKVSLLQRRSNVLPQSQTCDVLVLDRSVDVVSPVIHEWTYEAMVHDLADLNGKLYTYSVETQGGKTEQKEAVLDETDPVFCGLRHLHFADALVKISEQAEEFGQKNSAAKMRQAGGAKTDADGRSGSMTTSQMRRVMEALPQYRDAVAKLSTHVSLAEHMNNIIDQRNLTEVGKLEQDIVFGHARGKDVVNEFQQEDCRANKLDRLRLLMCYAATHTEKFDANACTNWASTARLQAEDVEATVLKLEHLGTRVRKSSASGLSTFSFSHRRGTPKQLGKKRDGSGEQWELGRFIPQAMDRGKALVDQSLPSDTFHALAPPQAEESKEEKQSTGSTGSLRAVSRPSSKNSWARKGEYVRALKAVTLAFCMFTFDSHELLCMSTVC